MKQLNLFIIIVLLCLTTSVEAKKKKPRFKPYALASTQTTDVASTIASTREVINSSPFKLVGEYTPYEGAHVFAITHPKLLEAAAKSEFGGYGAVIRLSVTATDLGTQLSYVNPVYMTTLYHIPEVPEVVADLEKTFGKGEYFGSKKGKSKRSLKNYQYMMFMPEFDDQDKLGKFGSHAEAVAAVNKNFSGAKLTKVFEVAIPGTEEVLFGVGIGEGKGADATVMPLIDKGPVKHTAHLPYGVLVSGNKVYALAGKFRIASSFPDLSMGQFMDISDAPDAIKKTLKQLAK